MENKIWVYVAGAYTKGDVVMNVRKALSVAEELIKLGYIPIVPHLSHFWHLIFPHPYLFWTDYDLEIIKRCDVLFRILGESVGADGEVEFAKEHNIPVMYSIEELEEWKNEMV